MTEGWKLYSYLLFFFFMLLQSKQTTVFGSTPHKYIFFSSLPPLADQKVSFPAFDVQSLLPKDLGRYYRYNGSLTTPPCYQSVIWTLFHERVQISKAQVNLRHWKQTMTAFVSMVDSFKSFVHLFMINCYRLLTNFDLTFHFVSLLSFLTFCFEFSASGL